MKNEHCFQLLSGIIKHWSDTCAANVVNTCNFSQLLECVMVDWMRKYSKWNSILYLCEQDTSCVPLVANYHKLINQNRHFLSHTGRNPLASLFK